MGIEEMTNASYFLFAASVILAVAAVVLFFALDIAKCWRMVSGRHVGKGKDSRKTAEIPAGGGEETLPLARRAETMTNGGENMPAPNHTGNERTEMLGTRELELIQDIVYVQDGENQGSHS